MKHETLVSSQHALWRPNFCSNANEGMRLGAGFMTSMADLGFSKGLIAETVVSTYNTRGQPNAAPMGVTMENEQRLALRIYTSSLTYRNLQAKRCAVVNVTSDPEMFYRTAFKEANPKGKVPSEWFEKAETVDAPRIRAADAHVEVTVADMAAFDAERAEVTCEVKLVKAQNVLPKAYCRASSATIEAVVHATRAKAFFAQSDRQKREQAVRLMEKIRQCHDVVNRVAPHSRYSEIMADLSKRVDSWRAGS